MLITCEFETEEPKAGCLFWLIFRRWQPSEAAQRTRGRKALASVAQIHAKYWDADGLKNNPFEIKLKVR